MSTHTPDVKTVEGIVEAVRGDWVMVNGDFPIEVTMKGKAAAVKSVRDSADVFLRHSKSGQRIELPDRDLAARAYARIIGADEDEG